MERGRERWREGDGGMKGGNERRGGMRKEERIREEMMKMRVIKKN